jgi:hypothetical protein
MVMFIETWLSRCQYVLVLAVDGVCVMCAGLHGDCDPFSEGRRSGESV